MSTDLVIFGVLDTASLAHFYLTHDSSYNVVAFTVHKRFLPQSRSFQGKPVVAFEEIEQKYPPAGHHLLAPLTARNMNRLRAGIYDQAKEKGYRLASYISSKATTFPDATIGDNCFILEDNTIQPYVSIGNNVVMWSGNHIGHHSRIGDHVFFTSHVVLSGHCRVDAFSFLGVNATVRDYTHLAEGTLVAMGACVTADTEPWGVYMGLPAKKGPIPSHQLDMSTA